MVVDILEEFCKIENLLFIVCKSQEEAYELDLEFLKVGDLTSITLDNKDCYFIDELRLIES